MVNDKTIISSGKPNAYFSTHRFCRRATDRTKENGSTNCFLECKTNDGKTVAFWGTKGGEKANLMNIHKIGGKKAPVRFQASKHYKDKPGYDIWIPETADIIFLS